MSDPRKPDIKARPERATAIGFGAGPQAKPATRDGAKADLGSQAAHPHTLDPQDADQRAARRLVLATIAVTLVAAGGIEWAGWQIVYRHADMAMVTPPDLLGVPRAQWALGTARNAAGALGVGVGAAALAMLFPWSRKRPWRAAAAAFAIGAATVLVLLGGLTSWAP